jgi:hypothetical protein
MSTWLAFALLRLRRGYGVLLASAALLAAGCATAPELRGPRWQAQRTGCRS